jgi:hypothetical protein
MHDCLPQVLSRDKLSHIKVEGKYQPRKRDSPRMKVPNIDDSIGITGAYDATKIGPRL